MEGEGFQAICPQCHAEHPFTASDGSFRCGGCGHGVEHIRDTKGYGHEWHDGQPLVRPPEAGGG